MEFVHLVVVIVLYVMEEVICSVCNVLQGCTYLELFVVKNVVLHIFIKIVIIILVFGIVLRPIIYKLKGRVQQINIVHLHHVHPHSSNIN